jgi:hypothetical protein
MSVLIATPSFDGNVTTDFMLSLLQTRETLDFDLCVIPGVHFVDTARDLAAARFLESSADYLFFIDSDLGFPESAVASLMAHGKDVVGGVYPIKNDTEHYPVACMTDKAGRPVVDGQLLRASGLPGGFLCIARRVVEALAAVVPRYQHAIGSRLMDVPAIFQREVIDGRIWGEDFMFCRRASALGFELWLDPDITFTHVGTKPFTGNYRNFLLRQPGGSEA